MQGETGDAEAAGDVVLFQHRIGGHPKPQSLRQHLRLLDAGLGHEDDEFVSAIAGNHVRLAALLFEQSANSSQHQISFQMAERIVDFLKFIQIDQHHREWPA